VPHRRATLPDCSVATCMQALQRGDPAVVGGLAAWRARAALLAQGRAWAAALQAAAQGLAWAKSHGSAEEEGALELRLLAARGLLEQGEAGRAVAALNALAGAPRAQPSRAEAVPSGAPSP